MQQTAPTEAFAPVVWPVRAARSVAAALVCVAVAAAGHALAGGSTSAPVLAAVLAGTTAITWCLAARRVTTGQFIGLLLLAQAVVHVSCAWSSDATSMGSGMLVAHAAATAVSAVVMTRGEAFLWVLAERLGLRALPLLLAPTGVVGRPLRAPISYRHALHDVTLVHTRCERGPPVVLA